MDAVEAIKKFMEYFNMFINLLKELFGLLKPEDTGDGEADADANADA